MVNSVRYFSFVFERYFFMVFIGFYNMYNNSNNLGFKTIEKMKTIKQKTALAQAIDLANEKPTGNRPNWWWKQKLTELLRQKKDIILANRLGMLLAGAVVIPKSNCDAEAEKYFETTYTQQDES